MCICVNVKIVICYETLHRFAVGRSTIKTAITIEPVSVGTADVVVANYAQSHFQPTKIPADSV